MDFQTGADPDVLFFFNGADANSFIEAGKVVPIDTIREVYPDYASNMNDDLITASVVDGVKYAVPVNGFWEAMFVNTEVLEAAGVEVPGADYTWDAFLEDCQSLCMRHDISRTIHIQQRMMKHLQHSWTERQHS